MTEKSMGTGAGQGGDFIVPQLAGRVVRKVYTENDLKQIEKFMAKAALQVRRLRVR